MTSLGKGLSAKCVLNPNVRCKKGDKISDNYVSKIVEAPTDSELFMKSIYYNELEISKLLKKEAKKVKSMKWLNEHFSIIDKVCDLDMKINKDQKEYIDSSCELEYYKKYKIFMIKNGGCKKLKVGSTVNIKNLGESKVLSIEGNDIKIKSGNEKYYINYSDLQQDCGDLNSEGVVMKIYENSEDYFKNIINKLINSLLFMHGCGISHCDIKPGNILMDYNGVVRIIDFGSSIYVKPIEKTDFIKICKNLVRDSKKGGDYELNKYERMLFYKIGMYSPTFAPPEFLISQKILIKNNNIEDILEMMEENDISKTKKNITLIKKLLNIDMDLIEALFCNDKELIFKYDVYSLGKTIEYIYKLLNSLKPKFKNKSLEDLIKKMTELDYNKRLSLGECLNHKYFK
jgi:serine/threonine protein kinase